VLLQRGKEGCALREVKGIIETVERLADKRRIVQHDSVTLIHGIKAVLCLAKGHDACDRDVKASGRIVKTISFLQDLVRN
jgi:hypothetical protein